MKTFFKWLFISFAMFVVTMAMMVFIANWNLKNELAEEKNIRSFSTDDLFALYKSNEVAADLVLKKKVVEIYGDISDINIDFTGTAIVALSTSNPFMFVQVRMNDSDRLRVAGLEKGETITVRCPKIIRVIGSPVGYDCRLH